MTPKSALLLTTLLLATLGSVTAQEPPAANETPGIDTAPEDEPDVIMPPARDDADIMPPAQRDTDIVIAPDGEPQEAVGPGFTSVGMIVFLLVLVILVIAFIAMATGRGP